jgi:hypothetical protein
VVATTGWSEGTGGAMSSGGKGGVAPAPTSSGSQDSSDLSRGLAGEGPTQLGSVATAATQAASASSTATPAEQQQRQRGGADEAEAGEEDLPEWLLSSLAAVADFDSSPT